MNPQFAFPKKLLAVSEAAGPVDKEQEQVRTSSKRVPRASSLASTGSSDKLRHHSRGSSLTATLLSHRSSYSVTGLTEKEEDLLNEKNAKYHVEAPWDEDDALHAATPSLLSQEQARKRWTVPMVRGWANLLTLCLIVCAMLGVFLVFPIASYFQEDKRAALLNRLYAWNLDGTNSTGQIPEIPGLHLIDNDTPTSARTRTGFDGQRYNLVFSDEFNTDGRTFWPGDDPYWEAVDLHYWGTGDLEWYTPEAVKTEGGSLVITLDEENINGMNYSSGMIQSWNKLCFTGGYIEVSVQLPGDPQIRGFWPGAWTMGNLGRAGFGATNDGTWSYSYDACDAGAYPNQTYVNGTGPLLALDTGENAGRRTALSYQPGQKLSACTCPGEAHPGPSVSVGRGAPEIDILEGLIWNPHGTVRGGCSQSAQYAPFDPAYEYDQTEPASTIYSTEQTSWNGYRGGHYQQACSAVSNTDSDAYELSRQRFATVHPSARSSKAH